jgi:uncharacterized protein YndB with AHSA1/START domain
MSNDTENTTPRNDAASGEVTYTRVHQAPADLLFECMTTPEHLSHFWGPTGTSAPVEDIVVDLRPGGEFRTVMVNDADGERYPTRAVYVEVERPTKLVWTEPDSGALTTITFRDRGDGSCEVITHMADLPVMFLSDEAQAGFQTSLDRCDAYVASLVAHR